MTTRAGVGARPLPARPERRPAALKAGKAVR